MSSSVNIPDHYTFDLGGTVDVGVTELPQINIGITQLPQIDIGITELPTINTSSSLAITQLPEIKFAVTELPPIHLIVGIRPTRIHLPTTMKFAVCAFGIEVLSFSTCGESMIVIEDYHPHAREQCR